MSVLIPLILMVLMVYKKVSAAFAAVIAAVVMCLLAGLNTLDIMKGEFMSAAAGFVQS